MAVENDFLGIIRDENEAPLNGAYYQAYFRQVNGGSSASIWKTAVGQTGADGYFSFNTADADFLGIGGQASPGDQVVIAVWAGSTGTRAALDKTRFGFIVLTLTSSQLYNQDIICPLLFAPTTLFTFPSPIRQLTDTTIENDCTAEQVVETPGYEDTYQQRSYGGEVIFDGARIASTAWTVDAVSQAPISGSSDLTLSLAQGTYAIAFTATDAWGTVGNTDTHAAVEVTYRPPVSNNLAILPASIYTGTLCTLSPDITDVDSTVVDVDYSVAGVSEETGLGVNETWQYTPVVEGTLAIIQSINWNDGFGAQVVTANYSLVVSAALTRASNYTFLAMRNRLAIFYKLSDQLTDSQVLSVLNECIQTGYEKVVSLFNSHAQQSSVSILSIANETSYANQLLGIPTYVGFKSTRLKYLPYEELREKYENFASGWDVGDPEYYSLLGYDGTAKTLIVVPSPKETGTAIDVLQFKSPPPLSSDTDYPLIPSDWSWIVLERAKIERLRFEEKFEAYQLQGQEFVAYIKVMAKRCFPAAPEPEARLKQDPDMAAYNAWRGRRI